MEVVQTNLEQTNTQTQQITTTNDNSSNPLVTLFKTRKGLVTTWLLPFLTLDDKISLLPSTSSQIRIFMTQPTYELHFYNLVYTDFMAYADFYKDAYLNLMAYPDWVDYDFKNTNHILCRIQKVNDWHVFL